MKLKLVCCAFGFAFSLCGCASEFNVQRFGSGGLFSVKSWNRHEVFDFSKDGKYLWLSETNCYDLSGRPVDMSALDDSSHPLPRMKWKSRILGSEWNYWCSDIRKNIEAQAVQWCVTNHLWGGNMKVAYSYSKLTFPATSVPIVTVMLGTEAAAYCKPGSYYKPRDEYIVQGVFTSNAVEEISFKAVKIPPEMWFPLGYEIVVSESLGHIANTYVEGKGRRFSDVRMDFEARDIALSDEVVVGREEVWTMLGDKSASMDWFDAGVGFLSENYFSFPANRGGRNMFYSRDYLLVYGFRERRIVKAFKGGRQFNGAYIINDKGIVMSADEKYLAIRYNGVITVYQFNVDGGNAGPGTPSKKPCKNGLLWSPPNLRRNTDETLSTDSPPKGMVNIKNNPVRGVGIRYD